MTSPEFEALISYLEGQLSKLATELPAKHTIQLGPHQIELLKADSQFMHTPHLSRLFGVAGYWRGVIILSDTHKEG